GDEEFDVSDCKNLNLVSDEDCEIEKKVNEIDDYLYMDYDPDTDFKQFWSNSFGALVKVQLADHYCHAIVLVIKNLGKSFILGQDILYVCPTTRDLYDGLRSMVNNISNLAFSSSDPNADAMSRLCFDTNMWYGNSAEENVIQILSIEFINGYNQNAYLTFSKDPFRKPSFKSDLHALDAVEKFFRKTSVIYTDKSKYIDLDNDHSSQLTETNWYKPPHILIIENPNPSTNVSPLNPNESSLVQKCDNDIKWIFELKINTAIETLPRERDNCPVNLQLSADGYATKIGKRFNQLYEMVRKNRNLRMIKAKTNYDRVNRAAAFKINDNVLLLNSASKVGLTKKLSEKWRGPFTVIENVNDLNYRIQCFSKSGKYKILFVHRNRLKKYHGSPMQLLCADEVIDDLGEKPDRSFKMKTKKCASLVFSKNKITISRKRGRPRKVSKNLDTTRSQIKPLRTDKQKPIKNSVVEIHEVPNAKQTDQEIMINQQNKKSAFDELLEERIRCYETTKKKTSEIKSDVEKEPSLEKLRINEVSVKQEGTTHKYNKDDCFAFERMTSIATDCPPNPEKPNPYECSTERMRLFVHHFYENFYKNTHGVPAGFKAYGEHKVPTQIEKTKKIEFEFGTDMRLIDKERYEHLLMKIYGTTFPSVHEILIDGWYKPFDRHLEEQSIAYLQMKLDSLKVGSASIRQVRGISYYCTLVVKLDDTLSNQYVVAKINSEQWFPNITAYEVSPYWSRTKLNLKQVKEGKCLSSALNRVRAEFFGKQKGKQSESLEKIGESLRKERYEKFKQENPEYFDKKEKENSIKCFLWKENVLESKLLSHIDFEHPAIGSVARLSCQVCLIPLHTCLMSDFVQLDCGHFTCQECNKNLQMFSNSKFNCFMFRKEAPLATRLFPYDSDPSTFTKQPVKRIDEGDFGNVAGAPSSGREVCCSRHLKSTTFMFETEI
ncbi:Retrovirus-related Pol poly from transposon, partial [Brachionus plicatilis]